MVEDEEESMSWSGPQDIFGLYQGSLIRTGLLYLSKLNNLMGLTSSI
jgi:hypothetical protein